MHILFLPPQENEYVQAIRSVASVLAPYDTDQLIPAFGFGARLPPDGQISHCFPLNFNHQKPEVYGAQVSAYLCLLLTPMICNARKGSITGSSLSSLLLSPQSFHDSDPTALPTFPQGILDAYRYSLSQVQLYGPTNFSTFLDRTIGYATGSVTQESQNYTILLIITVSRSTRICVCCLCNQATPTKGVCVCVCVCVCACACVCMCILCYLYHR